MPLYKITFQGRKLGDIGIPSQFAVTVEAKDIETAKRKLYGKYEHISILEVEMNPKMGDPSLYYQRGPNGETVAPDGRSYGHIPEYGPIPKAELFQRDYGYRKPDTVHGWQWSATFGQWSALVSFDDWHGWTWPRPEYLTADFYPDNQPTKRKGMTISRYMKG